MRQVLAVIAAFVCVLSVHAQDVIKPGVGETIDKMIRSKSLGQFWGGVLVAKDGEILLAKGYGIANQDLAPMTADSLFDIASITKCFTSAAVLKLAQDGKLSLDDPLSKFFTEVPENKQLVTVRHLMTHTSGIAGGGEEAYQQGDLRDPVVAGLLKVRVSAKPGTRHQYSNVGYFLLAAIIEKVSGTTWEKYVTDAILRPAGMKSSGCCGDASFPTNLLTARMDGDWGIDGNAASWPYAMTWGYRGAGGVVSSVVDMYAWDRALRGDSLFTAATRQTMFTPALNSYAMGWEVRETGQGRTATHTGGVRGYRTIMTRWLEKDACIVILTNEIHEPFGLMKSLSEAIFPELVEKTSFHAYIGSRKRGEYGSVAIDKDLVVGADPVAGGVKVTFRENESAALEISLSESAANALIGKLNDAVDGVLAEGASKDKKGMVLEIYTGPYKLKETDDLIREGEGVSAEAMAGLMHPEPGGEKKVLLYIKDDTRHMLPVFIKLEAGTASELAGALKTALGG